LAAILATFGLRTPEAAGESRESASPPAAGTSATLPDPVQGANPLLAPNSAALLSATVSGGQDGTTFRASFAPGRLDLPYLEVLSESKLSLAFNSTTTLARFVYSVGYNPFALRGYRVARIIETSNATQDCGSKF
jgi:hypothetical protein